MRDTHMHTQSQKLNKPLFTKYTVTILSKHSISNVNQTTPSLYTTVSLSHLLSGVLGEPLNDVFQLSVRQNKTKQGLLNDTKHVTLN